MIAEADVVDVAHQEAVELLGEDEEVEPRAAQRLSLYVHSLHAYPFTNLTPAGTPPSRRNLRCSRKGRHVGN